MFVKRFPITLNTHILNSPIEYLKGVGPHRGDLLRKEAGIFTFQDLLTYFPLRHIDKTQITPIRSIGPEMDYVQTCAKILSMEILGQKAGRRLAVQVTDGSAPMELVWFQGISWIQKMLEVGSSYRIFGKVSFFK
ncbi:MAG: ATP-dependent DNA helicase RecG, partial [Bacteroidota bacterium]|nr:ATP-dependent DNA helicase RecG [Bacteroidota bacterium]